MRPRIAITVGAEDVVLGATRQTYRTAIEQAGGEPVLVSNAERGGAGRVLADFDGLLIPGGKDIDPSTYGGRPHPAVEPANPDLDAFEQEAARFAKRSGLPTLAICRGIQVVNVAFGGTLYEDIVDQYEAPNGLALRHSQTPDFSRKDTTHDVDLQTGCALANILGSSTVATNTLHHQAVRRIAYDLEPVGRARDGIVEALELRSEHPFFVAVQWHPEELVGNDGPSRKLFAAFVDAAARRARGRGKSSAAT